MRILLLLETISISYPAAIFSSLSASCCWLLFFCTVSQKIDIISKPQVAKRSPCNCRQGVKAFLIVFSRNILNSTGDNGYPCRTLTVVWKKSQTLPLNSTALVISSYGDLTTSISWLSMLYSFKTRQRPSCQRRFHEIDEIQIQIAVYLCDYSHDF